MQIQPLQHASEDPSADGSSDGIQLLGALWRAPHQSHLIGVMDRQTKQFGNIPVRGVTEAVERALKSSDAGAEAYFACAEYLGPDSRCAKNASGAWAFWMDIDCGAEKAEASKGYLTTEDAEQAIETFCSDAGLPSPTHLVDSGGGLHAYWVLDSEIERDVWRAYAAKLKALTRTRRLLADGSRTADIASVLRVPGTLNHKYAPPKPVSLKHVADEFIARASMLDAIRCAYDRLCHVPACQPSVHTVKNTYTADAESRYGRPDLAKLASAMSVLDPDCDEETWKLKRLAPLADAARQYPDCCGALYGIAKFWSSGELRGTASRTWVTPSGNGRTGEEVFDEVWERFLKSEYDGIPVTLGTIYFDAKKAGWAMSFDPSDQFEIIDDETEGAV